MSITTDEFVSEKNTKQFNIKLDQFEGPFDLLLSLIAKHELEVTALALHIVTDDFLSYIKNQGSEWDLNEATEFLVIAATLLDLKTARLLPSGEVEDESDLALLEARDLLFARLLQYRAFKEIASIFNDRISIQERTFARMVALDPKFAELLPEVLIGVAPTRFVAIAQRVLSPKITPVVGIEHIHRPLVSVAEESARVVEELRKNGRVTFRHLVAGVTDTLVVVARFLGLLELYREGVVRFEQVAALGELQITWTGSASGIIEVSDEFDIPQVNIETDEEDNV